MSRVFPYLWYPAFFAAAIWMFGFMLEGGSPLLVALYSPIALVALAIIGLEWLDPERLDWRPDWSDVRADALFMIFIQVLLPRVLSVLLVLLAADWMHARVQSNWWPQHWSFALQAILMVIVIDLVRYWLHRACHSFAPLWRLHEVHHSPDILYALNVGRFHPLEKLLHFSLDTVPFVLLGVAPEVIAIYFLLYAVNGFFQHSNVRLRYGFLNYIVGSAETHRWHHARDLNTANCNFSNTTIVWDLVFGTWYLPKDRSLEIGIPDRSYPKDFWSQMATPFRPTDKPVRSHIADLAINFRLASTRWIAARQIAAATRDPMRPQRKLLQKILHDNRNTTYGREHGFANIKQIQQFQQQAPVAEFEALRPYVEAEIERGEAALTAEPPVRYLRTSGTTGQPKDVPLTASHMKSLKRIHRIAVAQQLRLCPEAFDGSILIVNSPAIEGRLSNGKPYGAASGVVVDSTPRLIRDKFVVPPLVQSITDCRVKYLLILRLALTRPDVSYLASANASTMLSLMKLLREHAVELIDDLQRGGFFLADRVPAPILRELGPRLGPKTERARRIESLVSAGKELCISDLWPNLRLVVTWTCGSAGVAVATLRKELSAQTRILELGYLSSEFRGTITLGRRAGSGLPTFDTHFFEFIERERWDRNQPEFLTLDQLRRGQDYYIIVTTPSGLYRYFINDLVRVRGFLHRMPLIKFLQKGKGVTNITGEKLYESQVLEAVHQVMHDSGCTLRFMMTLADVKDSRYRLYVETGDTEKPDAVSLAQAVDEQLKSLNVEYRAKRSSERLAPLIALWLKPGTEEHFRQYAVDKGQREGQFKVVALALREGFAFDLDACTEPR